MLGLEYILGDFQLDVFMEVETCIFHPVFINDDIATNEKTLIRVIIEKRNLISAHQFSF